MYVCVPKPRPRALLGATAFFSAKLSFQVKVIEHDTPELDMSCYDAFDEILEDFKHLLDRREKSIRQVEERLTENLLEESQAIRRLEHQVHMSTELATNILT